MPEEVSKPRATHPSHRRGWGRTDANQVAFGQPGMMRGGGHPPPRGVFGSVCLASYPVRQTVNKVQSEGPGLLEPAA